MAVHWKHSLQNMEQDKHAYYTDSIQHHLERPKPLVGVAMKMRYKYYKG